MYSVFKYSSLNIPTRNLGNCRFIRDKLLTDYKKYIERVRSVNRPKPNGHILVKFLKMLEVPIGTSDVDFFLLLRTRIKFIANTYGLVSIYSPGKSYGGRIFILKNSDPFEIKDYKNIEYIRYKYIPTINFSYDDILSKGFIEIDMMAMGIGYHLWRKEQIVNNPDIYPNPGDFVFNYILPNSIPSRQAVSLINYLYTDKQPEFFRDMFNQGLLNPLSLYKEVKRNFKKNFKDSNFRIGFPLYSVKCILIEDTLAKFLFTNYNSTDLLNRYNSYIHWIYYSYYLTLMLEFHGENAIYSNRYLRSEIRRALQTLRHVQIVNDTELDLKLLIDYTINILNKYLKKF